ncbi:SDR family oxidoreductase [Luteimonas sp. TWI1416]|uniref:SDR family NAD(P)-dependent oxidoreductase n=1 Tax=unclassified Luteimonas TaxID=2629088 RepID=UPI00320A9888
MKNFYSNGTRPMALITGGSGGIGAALAECFARDAIDLILVGRNKASLEATAEIARRKGVRAITLAEDLTLEGAAERIFAQVRTSGSRISYLVNNAGVGVFGKFAESSLEQELAMLRLNTLVPTALCKMFLSDLVENQGRIMNVASLAAFQPGPYMAAYYGSKAYLLWLSEAVGWELRRSGVSVTAFCPGPTRTGFAAAAGMEESGLIKGKRLDDASKVAEGAYLAMHAGRAIYIPGWVNRALAFSSRFVPRQWMLAAVSAMSAPRAPKHNR